MAEPIDILVVDDNPIDGQIFQEALRQASPSARCHWVAGGEEAIKLLRQEGEFKIGPIKLVVLDVNMPGVDGFETLRRIRSSPDLSRVPVVFFSSSIASKEVDRSYSLGGNAFFQKPRSLSTYVKQVQALVDYWLQFAKLPSPERTRTQTV